MSGLNRDLLRLNNVLRMKRGQESTFAAESQSRLPATALPSWLKKGSRCCYVSKTTGGMHNVMIQKIDERSQTVTVVFEADAKNGKKVPFSECSKMGDGTLRPVWKANQQAAGPAPAPAAPAGAKAEAPARPAKAAKSPGKEVVEDVVSSGDEAPAEPYPQLLQPLPQAPEPERPKQLHFLPRAVALGGKKDPPTMGPAPRPDDAPPSPPGAGESEPAPGPTPAPAAATAGLAEISDDEDGQAKAKRGTARSRSRRRSGGGAAAAGTEAA